MARGSNSPLLAETDFPSLSQTDPSVQSVQLIGSWDNFTTPYTMKRDLRRGQDQWRGCYAFKDIVREDSISLQQRRSGGLKMGHTYFYYYEVDGLTETFDPSLPYTTACPYLPGQTVNTLAVPVERPLRYRSASTNSIRQEDFKTMDPDAKFNSLKASPPAPSQAGNPRAASASLLRPSCPESRSVSPTPSWRRLFERKRGRSRGRSDDTVLQKKHFFSLHDSSEKTILLPTVENDSASTSTLTLTCPDGARTGDASPKPLHQRMLEDHAMRLDSGATERPTLRIPNAIDDIDADETDDEDSVVASAVSESQSFFTRLSPPPFKRSGSSESIPAGGPMPPIQKPTVPRKLMTKTGPRWSISVASRSSPVTEEEPLPLYDLNDLNDSNDSNDLNDSEDNDDNDENGALGASLHSASSRHLQDSFRGYSLPRLSEESHKPASPGQSFASFNAPEMIPRGGPEIPSGSTFLGGHIDTGLDDFVSEMGWIMDVIGTLGDN